MKRLSWQVLLPGRIAWRGAIWALSLAVLCFALVSAYGYFQALEPGRALAGALVFLASVFIAGTALAALVGLLRLLPFRFVWAVATGLILFGLLALRILMALTGVLILAAGIVLTFSILGAAVAVLLHKREERLRLHRYIAGGTLVISLVVGGFGAVWLLQPGAPMNWPVNAARALGANIDLLTVGDPSKPGPYPVMRLCYGNETGRWRASCTTETYLTTESVDGTAFLEQWGNLRQAYWGFGPEALPLNARVWYPDGDGPFPLVLIVHGNAPMEKWSDMGYGYLGELWASRGFIVASVDENFLNLSHVADLIYFNRLTNENDARAWLLLEHLRLWHEWHEDTTHPLAARVDLDNIALTGHSRGGEAVAIAAAFNRLAHYPYDARVSFNYGYNIRGVIAIAPSEGQYMPSQVGNPLEDMNYLVIHGAHDMDVVTFMGARQYNRVRFSEDTFRFKAALYIFGANHGQFNTVWGYDLAAPARWLYNDRQLLRVDEQEQIAKVYLTAFLEATLRDERAWLPLFRDYRTAPVGWLPDTIYLNQYADSTTRWLSTYEEDIDPATATWPGVTLAGERLSVWREQIVPARWEDTENKAVFLGWDTQTNADAPAHYTLHLQGRETTAELEIQAQDTLVFDLADAKEDPTAGDGVGTVSAAIDFTVEAVDRHGAVARLPLSSYAPVQPQLESVLTKARFLYVLPHSEVVFQTFAFPMQAFVAANPAFEPAQLATIRLVFDRTPAGAIVLDNVGMR